MDKKRSYYRIAFLSIVLCLALLSEKKCLAQPAGYIIEGGREAEITALFSPYRTGDHIADNWDLNAIVVYFSTIRVVLKHDGVEAEIVLQHPLEGSEPYAETRNFKVTLKTTPDTPPGFQVAVDKIVATLRQNEKSGFWHQKTDIAWEKLRYHDTPKWFLNVILLCCLLGSIAGLVLFIRSYKEIGYRTWAGLAILILLGILLRCIIPSWAILHTNGHGIARLNLLLMPDVYQDERGFRDVYSDAYFLFYTWVTSVLERTDRTIFAFNVVLNVLSAIPFFMIAIMFFNSTAAGLFSAFLLLSSPIYIRLAASESHYVAIVFFYLGTLSLYGLYRHTSRWYVLVAALCFQVFAMHLRVLTLSFPLLISVFLLCIKGIKQNRRNLVFAFLAMLSGSLIALPHFLYLLQFHKERLNVAPAIDTYLRMFFGDWNIFFNLKISPLILPMLFFFGLIVLAFWRRNALIFVIGGVLYSVQYFTIAGCFSTMLRYQSGVLFIYLLSCGAATMPLERLSSDRKRQALYLIWLMGLTWLLSLMEIVKLNIPDNDAHEYYFIRSAIAELPDDFVLVHQDEIIPPGIHTVFPRYMLSQAGKKAMLLSITEFMAQPETFLSQRGEVIYYQGLSCYWFGWDERAIQELEDGYARRMIQPNCESMCRQFELMPLVTYSFENYHPDDWVPGEPYNFCHTPQKHLQLGFYKIGIQ